MRGEADFEMLFRNEYPIVVGTTVLLVGDRGIAEELAQEAFSRLYARWGTVRLYDRPGACVRRVAINLALSWKTRRRMPADRVEPVLPPGDLPVDVRRAILGLPRMQRAVVALHYFEDLGVEECADVLRCSPNTVKVHLHRARKRLADVLAVEDADGA